MMAQKILLGVALTALLPVVAYAANPPVVATSSSEKPLPSTPQKSDPLPIPAEGEEAKPAPVIPKPLNVMPVKIKPVQTSPDDMAKAAPISPAIDDTNAHNLENLTSSSITPYPADFWRNSTRDDLVGFLSLPESVSEGRALRAITIKASLTPAPHLAPTDDASKNLYALRISRMLSLGDFDTSVDLYKQNEAIPPNALAARAGVESFLGRGDVGVACLEQKALPPALKTDTPVLWKNISAFCQILLERASGAEPPERLKNASQLYVDAFKPNAPDTPRDINGLDTVSLLTLSQAGKFGTVLDNPAAIRQLTDKKIALFLTFGDKAPNRFLPVMAEALRRGLLDDDKALSDLKIIADTIPAVSPYAPLLKEIFNTGVPLLTERVMELADTPPKQLLLLPLLVKAEGVYPDTKQKEILLKLLTLANQPLPSSLLKKLYNLPESSISDGKNGEEMLAEILWNKNNSPLFLALKSANSAAEQQNAIYDNLFSLTEKSNYVMHSADTLSSLIDSANKKLEDQVVIKSLTILSATTTEKLNPAALYRILMALDAVGLKEEKSSLMRYVLGTTLVK